MQIDDRALEDFDRLPDGAHIGPRVVERILGAHRATIWRWVKSGRLPPPKKFGPQTCRWTVGEIRQAIAAMSQAA